MRRTRRLILLLIAAIVAVVGITYFVQKTTQARNAPQKLRYCQRASPPTRITGTGKKPVMENLS